jgi:hypothetical protein
MDKLLGQDWTPDAFIRRYSFVDPRRVLLEPIDMRPLFAPYVRPDGRMDVDPFLKRVHGLGIVQAFDNAIQAADCRTAEPFERLRLSVPLDLGRIRSGESKYLLRDVFRSLYPRIDPPPKVPFARPMDQWMRDWQGPRRPEFRRDLDLAAYTGEQRWLLYCLERFLDLLDADHA